MDRSSGGVRLRNRRRTEAEIRAAAAALFLRRGYDETSVDEIAVAAGVSRRTIFRYFPGKADVLFGRDEQVAGALRQALERTDGGRLSDHLRDAILALQFGSVPSERDATAIARLIERHPELEARQARFSVALEAVVQEFLRGHGLPDRAAILLAGALFGALRAARRTAARSDDDPRALVAAAFDVLAPAFDAVARVDHDNPATTAAGAAGDDRGPPGSAAIPSSRPPQ